MHGGKQEIGGFGRVIPTLLTRKETPIQWYSVTGNTLAKALARLNIPVLASRN